MAFNLVEATRDHFGPDVIRMLAQEMGEEPQAVARGLEVAIPEVTGGIVRRAESEDGARILRSSLLVGAFDAESVARMRGMLDDGESMRQLAERGGGLLLGLFGSGQHALAEQLSSFSGVRRDSAQSLLELIEAMAMGTLGCQREAHDLDAGALRALLSAQPEPAHTVTPVHVVQTSAHGGHAQGGHSHDERGPSHDEHGHAHGEHAHGEHGHAHGEHGPSHGATEDARGAHAHSRGEHGQHGGHGHGHGHAEHGQHGGHGHGHGHGNGAQQPSHGSTIRELRSGYVTREEDVAQSGHDTRRDLLSPDPDAADETSIPPEDGIGAEAPKGPAFPVAHDRDVARTGHTTQVIRQQGADTDVEGPAKVSPDSDGKVPDQRGVERDDEQRARQRADLIRERAALTHDRETASRERRGAPASEVAGPAAPIPGSLPPEVPPTPVPHRRIEPVRTRDVGFNPGRWVLPALLAAAVIIGWSLLRNGQDARRADALVAQEAGQRQGRGATDSRRESGPPPRGAAMAELTLPDGTLLRAPEDSGLFLLANALEQGRAGSATGGSGEAGAQRFAFNELTFEGNASKLTSDGHTVVGQLAKVLEAHPDARIRVEGHTAGTGAPTNRMLSQERADAVKTALVEQGIDDTRIEARGHGDSDPVASADTAAGRRANSRTDVILLR